MKLNLIPYPKKAEFLDEKIYLGGLDIGLSPMCDTRLFKAAKTFKAEQKYTTQGDCLQYSWRVCLRSLFVKEPSLDKWMP